MPYVFRTSLQFYFYAESCTDRGWEQAREITVGHDAACVFSDYIPVDGSFDPIVTLYWTEFPIYSRDVFVDAQLYDVWHLLPGGGVFRDQSVLTTDVDDELFTYDEEG